MGLYLPGSAATSTVNWDTSANVDVKEALKKATEAFEKLKGLPKPEFESIVITREAFERYISSHCDTQPPNDATGFETKMHGVPIRVFNTNQIATVQAYTESTTESKCVLLFTIECGKPSLKVFNGPEINKLKETFETFLPCPRQSLNLFPGSFA